MDYGSNPMTRPFISWTILCNWHSSFDGRVSLCYCDIQKRLETEIEMEGRNNMEKTRMCYAIYFLFWLLIVRAPFIFFCLQHCKRIWVPKSRDLSCASNNSNTSWAKQHAGGREAKPHSASWTCDSKIDFSYNNFTARNGKRVFNFSFVLEWR